MYFTGAISFLADPKILMKNCLSLTALYKVFVGYGHLIVIIVTRSYKNCQVLFNKTKELLHKMLLLLLQCHKRTLVNSNGP
jgi:hypothetical protein